MRCFLAFILIGLSPAAFAQNDAGTLTCALRYKIPTEPGMVKYVMPDNGYAQIHLVSVKFCNDQGCEMKSVGSTFLGSAIGGASVRIVGDRTIVVLRDGNGNRSESSINTLGLIPPGDGATGFALNIDAVYKDEPVTAILFSCGLVLP